MRTDQCLVVATEGENVMWSRWGYKDPMTKEKFCTLMVLQNIMYEGK